MRNIAKEVLEVAIEDDVLEKLGDHEIKLKEHDIRLSGHDKQIVELQIKDAGYAERFNSIDLQFVEVKNCLTRIENNNYQSTNLLVSTISSIAQANSKSSNEIAKVEAKGETEITKIRLNNNTKLILKALAVISGIILAYIGGKHGISVK